MRDGSNSTPLAFTGNSAGYVDLTGASIDPMAVVALHARALFALRPLLDAANVAGISVAPVKGALTARWLYASVRERPFSDVDLRVVPEDLEALAAIAARKGWRVRWRDRVYRSLGVEIEGVTFDIETWIGAPWMSSLSVRAALARATRTDALLGVEHSRLDVHDHALVLALNVVKDRVGSTAPWAIEDLARVASVPEFDAEKMASVAWRAANASVLWGVASWMSRSRAVAGWASVERALGSVSRPRYARTVAALLSAREGAALDRMRRRLCARSASDDVGDRARSLGVMARWMASPLAWPVLQRT